MTPRHRLLAAVVAVLWGINFIAIHASLEQFPPFFLVALRWTLLAVPTLLFVPRPQVPVRWLLGYGVGFGVLQFAFLYTAMATGMPAGLASLVLQSSAPFSVVLGAVFLREHISPRRSLGVVIAVGGLAIVGSQRLGGATWLPFLLTVLGGLGWSIGNISSRQARPPKPVHLTMWMTVVPPIPMLALSFAVEGPDRIGGSLRGAVSVAALPAVTGLLYTCVIGTVVASGIWTWLLSRHPASSVAPFSMLVPVTGLTAAWVVLGEHPNVVELVGSAVVVAGVLLGSVQRRRRAQPTAAARSAGSPTAAPART